MIWQTIFQLIKDFLLAAANEEKDFFYASAKEIGNCGLVFFDLEVNGSGYSTEAKQSMVDAINNSLHLILSEAERKAIVLGTEIPSLLATVAGEEFRQSVGL